jgi:benzoate-CoA ligase
MSMAADMRARAESATPPGGSLGAIPREYNFAADLFSKVRTIEAAKKIAFIDSRGSLSYGDLYGLAEQFALFLEGESRPEQRVMICLPDTTDWPVAFLGTLLAGRVAVPVNTLLTEDDYRAIYEDCRPRILVVSEELYPKFEKIIAKEFSVLLKVVVCGKDAHGHTPFANATSGITVRGPYIPHPPTTRDSIAFWLYTSGSTGKPKGAVHTHADLRLTNELYAKPILGLTENDVVYSVAKLFFAYGLGNALTFPLSAGATTVLLPDRPTPDAVAALVKQHSVTVFFAVPTFYAAFLASPAAPQRDDLKLRCCVSAGEALPEEVGKRWRDRYGVDILDGIGSTEMLHIFLSNRAGSVKYGTTGRPVPGYDCKIVGDDGLPVKPGEMGELLVRGPTSAVMYWNNREQSRSTFLGEWTRSGDKYQQDADGYYVYCGRHDDMLKVSGMYVSPFEVEGALQSHGDVLEAAVVAWPDADSLIKPKAFVVLKDAGKAGDGMSRALQDHVKSRLAPYKYPRWIEFRADLPKTATGKIQRFKLRAEAPSR